MVAVEVRHDERDAGSGSRRCPERDLRGHAFHVSVVRAGTRGGGGISAAAAGRFGVVLCVCALASCDGECESVVGRPGWGVHRTDGDGQYMQW